MQQFCKYSGVVIQKDTTLNNLGLKDRDLITIESHQVFNLHIGKLLDLCTFKSVDKLTSKQRYLLTIAMIKATGRIEIKYPLNELLINQSFCYKSFYHLIDILIWSNMKAKDWKELKDIMPRMEIRKDNIEELNLLGFIKDTLKPSVSILKYANPRDMLSRKKSEYELDGSSIEHEYELKQQLLNKRGTKKSLFNVTIGRWVLSKLNKKLKKEIGRILTNDEKVKALHIFTSPFNKLKVTSKEIRALRELIIVHLGKKMTLQADDSIARSYISLTLGHLDKGLDYLTDINTIFGAMTRDIPAILPEAAPIQYTIKQLVPLEDIKYVSTIKDTSKHIASNPILQRILRRKKLANKGVS